MTCTALHCPVASCLFSEQAVSTLHFQAILVPFAVSALQCLLNPRA